MVVGAAEDDVKAGTLREAKAKLDLLEARRPERGPGDVDLGPGQPDAVRRRADAR